MTFSIVARDPRTGEFGVATSTAALAVGAWVPYAAHGVGAIASQAWTNPEFGTKGLTLLRQGVPVAAALQALIAADRRRRVRQVIGIDANSTFGHTGSGCKVWAGHRRDREFAVAGNILVGRRVIDAMARAFSSAKGDLAAKLLRAVEAGQAMGGDRRGRQSAALLVSGLEKKEYHDLRVDDHADPVQELRRIFEIARRMA